MALNTYPRATNMLSATGERARISLGWMAYNVRVDLRVHDESALLQVELPEVLLAGPSGVGARRVYLCACGMRAVQIQFIGFEGAWLLEKSTNLVVAVLLKDVEDGVDVLQVVYACAWHV